MNLTKNNGPRVRFAPSPTGFLHVGNARAAIFNWLFAIKNNGQMLLRIEDTDLERSRPEYLDSILNSLRWLKLDWSGGLVFQSKRMKIYHQIAQQLVSSGNAYFCQCDPERLALQREEAIAKEQTFTYPQTCRNLNLKAQIGQCALRLKLPSNDNWLSYSDLIRGEVSFPREQMDDFIIIRSDGSPTYNFCVVIDDHEMQITHVIRGEDHISNTPKQLALYQILNYQAPQFAHLPMILSPTGGRLSKRDGAVAVQDYLADGFLPEAMLNYLVRLGWSHGDQELFSRDELFKLFSLDQVGKKGAIFDRHKLEWFNEQYLKQIEAQELINYLHQELPHQYQALQTAWPEANQQLKLIEMFKVRHPRVTEVVTAVCKLAATPINLDVTAHASSFAPNTRAALEEFGQEFAKFDSATELLAWSKQLCEKHQLKLPFLAQPLRLAITGSINSPSIFELALIFSPQEVIARINNLLQKLQQ